MTPWKVTSAAGQDHVTFAGAITERTDFATLELRGPRVVLDLAGVRHVNSDGVGRLIRFLQELSVRCSVVAEHCSPVIINQLNMLPELSELLPVRSMRVELECPDCYGESELELTVPQPAGRPVVPARRCPSCDAEMAVGGGEDRYFAFLDDTATNA